MIADLVYCFTLQLGEQVAIARETLERALQLSDELNRDLNALNDWLNHLEAEIHKREGEFTENPNTQEEITFYEVQLVFFFSFKSAIEYLNFLYPSILVTVAFQPQC